MATSNAHTLEEVQRRFYAGDLDMMVTVSPMHRRYIPRYANVVRRRIEAGKVQCVRIGFDGVERS